MKKNFDIIIVGGGHAGIEAALCGARLGCEVLLTSISLNSIGYMACNPNIGGTAKGILVKEIDALGGEMGITADLSALQVRMLNQGNGAAVQCLRSQSDKDKYHRIMKKKLEKTDRLTILEAETVSLIADGTEIKGIKTAMGDEYHCKAVVLATGVYLNSKVIIGGFSKDSGPSGFESAKGLTSCLLSMGLPLRRFKTGTPPRLLAKSIDFSKMVEQEGDADIPNFSEMTDFPVENSYKCYLTYTNKKTHEIILNNLDKAPLYNGSISGTGPRYCPSIEDKVVRFADKDRHQLFVEPEGADTDEMYLQGLSTSLPYYLQEEMVHSVEGLENAVITRYGYAIEYDCIDPLALFPTLAVKGFKGLYTAGQINGSSGYEEAAAQGLVAGINAVHYLQGKEPFILRRDEAYIGVLIDDLVTKGTNEPYRMMTSRAEYRLQLRQDNADIRLTEKGRALGLVSEKRWEIYNEKLKRLEALRQKLKKRYTPTQIKEVFDAKNESIPAGGITAAEILKRSTLNTFTLTEIDGEFAKEDILLLKQIEVEIKYAGYLAKQEQSIREMRRMEDRRLPFELDYNTVDGLRIEAKQKLNAIKPASLAQASRISGVNPADIVVLMIYMTKNEHKN